MLRNTTSFKDYRIVAKDGSLGKVKDLLFDDRLWTVRYLVADSGTWLPGRRVLIVPSALGEPDWETFELPVGLTKEQVKGSPGIDENRPVSRQREIELHRYYGWSPYWPGPGGTPLLGSSEPASAATETREGDPSLRSVNEVTGYHIGATDGEVGHVEDFIVDDQDWRLRYVVVDTKNWLPGKKVLVSPQWIRSIDWGGRRVEVDLTQKQLEESAPYDPHAPVNRRYEEALYDFYGRPKYWH